MAVVVPLVAAFAAGAGGVAALGAAATIGGIAGTVATVAAYATIAGAVLTGVGALTGSKDLMKIGAVLSIGGGLTGAVAGLAGAAGGVVEGGAAASAAANGSYDAVGGLTAEEAAQLGGGAIAPAAPGSAVPVTTPTPGEVAPTVQPPAGVGDSLADAYKTNTTTTQPLGLGNDPNAINGTPNGLGDYGSSTGPGAAGTSTTVTPTNAALQRVAEGAKDISGTDVASWWEKARNAGGAVGKFVQDNPALVKIGGDMLSSMYGPAAEKMDWEKSIYNRARANLNAPIKLTYAKAGS